MVKPVPSWLKTSDPPASTSRKQAPNAESSSKAKKVDRKQDPPASARPASPPPAYVTKAPGAMPGGTSKAVARRDDYDDDYEDDFDDRKGKQSKRGGFGGGDDNRYGASRYGHEDYREDDRDNRKGKEVARRGKSRRDDSESESESDRGYKSKKKGKEMVKHKKDSGKKHKKSKKKQESSSESDSDEEIVEKRKRFEEIALGELSADYTDCLRQCFEVKIEKIAKWCDDGFIRIDTKDGSFNADKLINSNKVEDDEKKKWAATEKKYRRYIAEMPGGEMRFLPRFEKYLPKGAPRCYGGPSVVVVSSRGGSRRGPGHRMPTSPDPYRNPHFDIGCAECCVSGEFCGDPFHESY